MSAMREKDSADFDLEAFIDLFDEAITSDDPNVQKTLQHLMVIAALARNHNQHNHRNGPLRRLFEDLRDINNRLGHLETTLSGYHKSYGPVPPTQPTPVPTWTTGGTQWPPAPGTYLPGTVFGQGAAIQGVAPKSTTSYAWDPVQADMAKRFNNGPVERVEDLLRDGKYKGSSVGAADAKTA